MQLSYDAPTRPALRYYGSQWNNAKWIVSQWPAHNIRSIPFAGGLNEELQAPIVKLITANDLDGRVFNFFQVLRDSRDELIGLLKLTPWHIKEYELSKVQSENPLEDARRFFCLCWMSIQGGPVASNSGFRIQKSVGARWGNPAEDLINIDHLYTVSNRLKFIQFLQLDAREIIKMHSKEQDALTWCDPPFLSQTRARKEGYNNESTEQLHIDVANLLHRVKGYALVTGYGWNKDGTKNQLYQELYEDRGWKRVDKESSTNAGGKRIQSIWMSPKTYTNSLPIFNR